MTVEVLPALGRYDDFFEVVGVKKPGGAGCWCMAYRDSRVPNEERAQYMRDECAQEPGPGVLAYVDGEAAGWCSVAPRSTYRRLMRSRTIPFVDDRDAWSIVCFVVRPAFRRRGLMHELLEGAVAHARASGAEVVEGYPIAIDGGDRVDLISGYVGTRRLFEAAGFTQAAETTGHSGGRPRVIMRRELRDRG
ncbi:GNAT family N-acetyltransferase [Cellulomonas sp. Root137]|uniref:GNAT family N-acetyltransferase n=1 Tax=Cellulomonas sp. Root137 TaxID=1736459 RepID=UPI0006FA3184|nr:GNAT family N-acetyltransferase [Cellulomonas sp. Root137]KQY47006.1 GCN5 family acetyltransferase [Cellulomonas sp. Root137]KRD44148.1 GCN5 family acetyltransferase [Cellulomonas sp. Root930]